MARDIEDAVVMLAGVGFSERDVLYEWPYDKFQLFKKAAKRKELETRQEFIADVTSAIGGALGGKGLTKLLDEMKDVVDYDL